MRRSGELTGRPEEINARVLPFCFPGGWNLQSSLQLWLLSYWFHRSKGALETDGVCVGGGGGAHPIPLDL